MPKKVAVVGLGWLGLPLAKSFSEKGYDVIGSTTRAEKLMRLLKSNLSVRIIKITKNNLSGNWDKFIENADLLIINLPPGKNDTSRGDYPDQIEQLITRCPSTLKVIFVSSTSVYTSENEVVNEESLTPLDEESGSIMLEAENLVRSYFKENVTILRFSGLIGEGRHPGKFIENTATLKNPSGKVNLICLADCIQLIERIYAQNYFGKLVNGCADEHPTREEFYTKAALSLGLSAPVFEENIEFKWKIVSNDKSKKELGMVYSPLWDQL